MGNTQTVSQDYSLMVKQKERIENEDGISTTFLLPSYFSSSESSQSSSSSTSSSQNLTPRTFGKVNITQTQSEPTTPRYRQYSRSSKSSRSSKTSKTLKTSDFFKIKKLSSFSSKKQQFIRSKSAEQFDEVREQNTMTLQLDSIINKHLGNYGPQVLFDSKLHPFESRELFSRISFKDKLFFIFYSNDRLFGFYHSDKVCSKSMTQTTSFDAKTMFLFTMIKGNEKPMIFQRKTENKKSFTIHSREGNIVLTCANAFWIDINSKIQFNICFKDNYDIDKSYGNPFTGKFINGKNMCYRMVVLHCN